MEAIELEKGWLTRQMAEVRREVENWPAELLVLRSLNSSLVDNSSSTHEEQTAEDSDSEEANK